MNNARSTHAQIQAMKSLWPDFDCEKRGDGLVSWVGHLRPKGKIYKVAVFWQPGRLDRPYVWIIDPPIRPRDGEGFDKIPHLMFSANNPENSGLCLFDPDGNEWSPSQLIAETTMLWASEWLHYYELWHMLGEWLAPGVAPASVSEMTKIEAESITAALENVH